MILIGKNVSPFVRRVAVTLMELEIPFERELLSPSSDADRVRRFNPMGRVPALVLEDGDTLIESDAILDYLEEFAGPGRGLVPPTGVARRRVRKAAALMTGAIEKYVAGVYEKTKKPADKLHLPWREACQAQALAALDELEAWSPAPWFVGDELTQADVTAAVGYTFMEGFDAGIVPAGRYPNLERHRDHCEARPAFQATRPKF
jgi:glutathione S-transferase